ncbi:F-box/LRR-repeat protein 7 [Frankliniella fusca]|uniref:F-box/LRR-repeat protein 7 n=1 Tax=Frankliniella fusca TaxID=407009 RepID=A0AAE1H5P0_9NEOP|nr:F-box/LRR-repeat protein 7 [Frankliniella fusca]
MDSWAVSLSDKAWDFDENETCDVVFIDRPPNQRQLCFIAPGAADPQHLEHGLVPSSSGSKTNDEFGEIWVPPPSKDDALDDLDGPPLRKLFVGNLPYRVTDSKLKAFFTKFGKVINAHVKREPTKRRHAFYGFVTFHRPEDARNALKAGPKELSLFGYQLCVNKADRVHQPIELPDGTVQWLPGKRFYKESGEPVCDKLKRTRIDHQSNMIMGDSEDMETDEYREGEFSPFSTLNDDCLLHIFSFLSLTDRVRIERVCKRWQDVARSMWRRMHSLDMQQLALPPHHLHSSLCPNLQELDAAGVKLNKFGLQRLGSGCTKLRKLNLNYCSGVDERFLENLLKILPELESLSIAQWGELTGQALNKLPPETMRELNLNACSNLRPNELLTAVKRLPLLESLSLTSCISLSNQHVKTLFESVPQLRSLNMAQYFPRLKYASLESIGMLTNLRSLNVELNDLLTDRGIETIVDGCRELESLNITGCRAYAPEHCVTTKGITLLAKLPCLRELKMSYLADINDSALTVLAQNGTLQKLECRGCPSLKGDGFLRIISLCPDLELCDVSGCDHVKISIVKTAITAVKLRNNNIFLRLVVGGTGIMWEHVDSCKQEIPPHLNVELVDLSVPHLRPDFVDGIYFDNFSDYSDGAEDDLDIYDEICDDLEPDEDEDDDIHNMQDMQAPSPTPSS